MIRMSGQLGRLSPGDETDRFSDAEEAALVAWGVAEAVPAGPRPQERPHGARGYKAMPKAELAKLAASRGLDVPAGATKARLCAALEADDEADG